MVYHVRHTDENRKSTIISGDLEVTHETAVVER